jgi:hypothetical protein
MQRIAHLVEMPESTDLKIVKYQANSNAYKFRTKLPKSGALERNGQREGSRG